MPTGCHSSCISTQDLSAGAQFSQNTH